MGSVESLSLCFLSVLAGIEDEKHNHQNETNCHRDDKHRGTLDIILLRKVYKLAPPDFHPVDRVGVDAATAGDETQRHSVCAESNLVNHSPPQGVKHT